MKKNKYKDIIKYIMISIIACVAGCIGVICIFMSSSVDFKDKQSSYFDKVSYQIEGKILEMKNIGGNYYLIKILPEKFDLLKNELTRNDDCVGTFPEGSEYIYIIGTYDYGKDSTDTPLSIKLNTSNKSLVYDNHQKRTLRTAGLYRNRLPFVNDKKCVRF